MLIEPAPTQFDLRFRLLGVPVRVHPAFWLFTAIFGWSYLQALGFAHFLLHMAIIFVSFLVHEMGHVLMGRAFGEWGYIVLGSFFGLAIGNYERLRRWQRIAVSFAGPTGNFLLVGLGVAYGMSVAPQWNWLNMSEVLGYLIFFPAIRPDAGPALQWSLWASYFLVF